MTIEKVNDLEIVSLKSFFDAEKFRLIPADVVHFNGGISEVPVEINLHSNFTKRLNFACLLAAMHSANAVIVVDRPLAEGPAISTRPLSSVANCVQNSGR